MAATGFSLAGLPNELTFQIFRNLGSIDDALHLGRTCRAMHDVLENPRFYQDIMKSIISTSPIHRFDRNLCYLLELHGKIVQSLTSGDVNAPTSSSVPNWVSMPWEAQLYSAVIGYPNEDISVERVNDILARWQGLRVLQDIYLSRKLKGKDYFVPTHTSPHSFFASLDLLQDRGHSASFTASQHHKFNPDQTARFYTATVAYWVHNEIRWLLTQITAPNSPQALLSTCANLLSLLTPSPLLHHLDILSIYEFLYQHLLPLHSAALADQPPTRAPLTLTPRTPNAPQSMTEAHAEEMRNFLFAGGALFQPPDIIELAIRDRAMRTRPYPHLSPSDTTTEYQRPMPPGILPPGRRALLQLRQHILQVSWHANGQVPPLNIGSVMRGGLRDPHHAWLVSNVLRLFGTDADARPNRQPLDEVFEMRWREEGRWLVWWWAESCEKAECRLERWREG